MITESRYRHAVSGALSPLRWDWILILSVLSGVIGTAVSSIHLAGFPHGEVILPWQFPPLAIVLVASSGGFLFAYVYRKPQNFWPILIATNVITVGIYVLRFPIYDEYLTGCVVLGAGLAALQGRVPHRVKSESRIWIAGFISLVSLWLIMSIFGAVTFGNPKALRFTVIYAEILCVSLLLARFQFQLLNIEQFTRLILWSAAWYFIAVLVHGYGATFFREQEHIMEGIGFGGTAYQAAAAILACPVALFALANKQWRLQRLASLVLLLSLAIAILADSRAAMLPLVGVIFIAPIVLGVRRSIKMMLGAVAAVALLAWLIVGRAEWIFDMADAIARAFEIDSGSMTYNYYGRTVTAAKGDAGRFLYVQAGVEALVDNPQYWITGTGSYGYFPVAGPYYEKIADAAGIDTSIVNYGASVGDVAEPPRPPAAGAVIIESGLLGIFLFGVLMINNLDRAIFVRYPNSTRRRFARQGLALALPAVLILPWSYFGEFQDMILFYLILAPYGVIDVAASGLSHKFQMKHSP